MNELARALLTALSRQTSRSRVGLSTVWRAFSETVPGGAGHADARLRLSELLKELADAEAIRLPRTRRLWDRAAEPALPHWVALPRAERPARQSDLRQHAWPPELAFVTELARPTYARELLAVRAFLASGGAQRPMVPARERSLELFGDEKRLDALARTSIFGPSRLGLELLRCYAVPPPLTWEPGPNGAQPALLVIENAHTYASFRRWNLEARAYRAIAYGQGDSFQATSQDLPRLVVELGLERVEYFGDLDVRGLAIPAAAARELANAGIALTPATTWYELLLERAVAAQLPSAPAAIPPAAAWLGPALRPRVAELFAAGLRAPQELVGWEQLQAHGRAPQGR